MAASIRPRKAATSQWQSISYPASLPFRAQSRTASRRGFVKTFKRDYVRIHPLPDALTALQQDRRMVRGQPSTFRAQNALPTGVHPSPNTIAECPVKQGQLHGRISATKDELTGAWLIDLVGAAPALSARERARRKSGCG